MLVEGLYSLLAGAAPITSIVGTQSSRTDKTTGIFAGEMPEGAPTPVVVYRQVDGRGLVTMDGPDGLQFVRMQFSCYGKNYLGSKQLARAVRQVLEKFTGVLSEGTCVDNMQTIIEMDTFEEAPYLYHTAVDIEIVYADQTF
jgi:Protein of unknown function (DUF3168)